MGKDALRVTEEVGAMDKDGKTFEEKVSEFENAFLDYKDVVFGFYRDRQSQDEDLVTRIESLLDKQALLAIGAIPLSIAFIGPLLEKHALNVQQHILVLLCSWGLLISTAIIVAYIKIHFTQELLVMRSKHKAFELKLQKIAIFDKDIKEKVESIKEAAEGFEKSLHDVSLPIEALIGSMITLFFGLIWMMIFAVNIVFSL
jgi:hypothetical protein